MTVGVTGQAAKILPTIQRVMALFVEGKFDEIEWLTRGRRLSAEEISKAVKEYGRELINPPENCYQKILDIVPIEGSGGTWSVVCDFWTKEEGRSDLSVEMTLIDKGRELLDVSLQDIRVL